MFRFLHAADIHLDSPLRSLESYDDAPVEEIRGATRRAFENLIQLALQEQVAFLILAGDLYDGSWKDYNSGLFFLDQVGKLQKENIKVFMVLGNHDAASRITKTLHLPDNVYLFSSRKPETVILDSFHTAIHGYSYPRRDVKDNISLSYPNPDPHFFNIGILHTALSGRSGHEPYAPCTKEDLIAKGYDYWALGHVHTREIVSEDPWIIFPGNLQGRHIKEPGAKGATLVTVSDRKVLSTEHYELDRVRWYSCSVDIGGCETIDDVLERTYDQVKEAKEENDYSLGLRLEISGTSKMHQSLHADLEHFQAECRGIAASIGGVWLEKILLSTKSTTDQTHELYYDSPLQGLHESFTRYKNDPDKLQELIPDLHSLQKKLPHEFHEKGELLPRDPDEVNSMLEEIQEMLIKRMLEQHKS